MRPYFIPLISLIIGCYALAPRVHALELDALQHEAQVKELASHEQWLALLHYDSSFPTYAPQARTQSKRFFHSPDGASSPQEELDATLFELLTSTKIGDEHPRCLFPARFEWLSTHLSFPESLRDMECPRLREWYEAINPHSVTVIFPASFLNNPASAFGHTFIRLDQAQQNEETRLLAYAADYSAATSGEDALTYAVKGVFGGYDGFYAVTPYYKKVTKYSDLENRDIWEYSLSFNSDEVRLLTLHLWELREVPFSYYYFDENCSYHILGLLDVARPSLGLIKSFRTWVLPVDTLRELFEHKGLVTESVFRPSAATKLHHRISHTSKDAQEVALEIVQDKNNVQSSIIDLVNDDERARALDLGYDFLTYERIKSGDDTDEGKTRSWTLLAERSKLPTASLPNMEKPFPPERGHKTALISVGYGSSKGESIGELSFRPAFHALVDRQDGYIPGAQIVFFDTALRLLEEEGFRFERFTPLAITSLTPRDDFFTPTSWQVLLESSRNSTRANASMITELKAGAGRSYLLHNSLQVYGLLDGSLQTSGALDENYALGIGPKVGAVFSPVSWFGSEIGYEYTWYEFGEDHQRSKLTTAQRVSFSDDLGLRLDVTHHDEYDTAAWTGLIRIEYFFTP